MLTRTRATTTTICTKNMRRKKGHNQPWSKCPNNPNSKIARAAITANVRTNEAEADLGTMEDGVRGTVTIIMKMEIEIATDFATIIAICIPEAETENFAEAVAERCPAQRHGALIAPLGHPLSV